MLPTIRKILAHPKALYYAEESTARSLYSTEWWKDDCIKTPNVFDDPRYSGKLMLLFSILSKCYESGEKVVVFSDCLSSFNAIEYFLSVITKNQEENKIDPRFNGLTGSWKLGTDYFLMDGSINVEQRKMNVETFNDMNNTRAR